MSGLSLKIGKTYMADNGSAYKVIAKLPASDAHDFVVESGKTGDLVKRRANGMFNKTKGRSYDLVREAKSFIGFVNVYATGLGAKTFKTEAAAKRSASSKVLATIDVSAGDIA